VSDVLERHTAVDAPNRFVELYGRKLAWRSIGTGTPIILCTRFRGNMDLWDPAFLDALAGHGFQVITFDYSGLGLSTGTATYNPIDMARDPADLAAALNLRSFVVAGWSLGGLAAQAMLAIHPVGISHLVLIGTNPPGPLVKPAEQLFFDVAGKAENDFEDVVVLFFEPKSPASRAAASRSMQRIAQRQSGLSKPVPVEFAREKLGTGPSNPAFPADAILEVLKTTTVPILHIGGDHDIIFPVENWYALNGQLPTLQLLTWPRAGHGPQHEHPDASAAHIATFIRSTTSALHP
jgi:pimeloyl-ACP methyl ester carboxylesterase